jgi:hypothetical protein
MSGIVLEAAPSLQGLRWFTTKRSGLLGWATKPSPEALRVDTGSELTEKLRSRRHMAWSRCLCWEDAKAQWMLGRPMENFMCWPKYLVRVFVVTPSVGAIRSFSEGLYIGVAEFQPTHWLVVGVLFYFGVLFGREGDRRVFALCLSFLPSKICVSCQWLVTKFG